MKKTHFLAVLALSIGVACLCTGCPKPAPGIGVSLATLNFGTALNQLSFQVWNNVAKSPALTFQVSSAAPWITGIAPVQGTSTGVGNPVQINVTVSRAGLAAGTHTGVIVVSGNAPTVTIQISIEVAGGEGEGEDEGEGGDEGENEGEGGGEGEGENEGEGSGEGEAEGEIVLDCGEWSLVGSAACLADRMRITSDTADQVGGAWLKSLVDLTQNLDFEFRVYLGNKDEAGADGIAFVFAPDFAATGNGEGLGYTGIAPSLAIEVDTYPNDGAHLGGDQGDPLADHIAVQAGGDSSHFEMGGRPLVTVPNLEDNAVHTLRVVWNAAAQNLQVYLDDAKGAPVINFTSNIVANFLDGQSSVRFGVTGSTGELSNEQYIAPTRLQMSAAQPSWSWTCGDWHLADSAACDLPRITITPDDGGLLGAAWYNTQLNLAQDFDMEFRLYFGNKDDDGADGMVFVMTPSIAGADVGEGLGYAGITPSVAVEFDTYPNDGEHFGDDHGDPEADHVAVDVAGSVDHFEMAGRPFAEIGNVEDGFEHRVRIQWTAAATTLRVYLDDVVNPLLEYVSDLPNAHLDGNSLVYFGFTGSTGVLSNQQYFIPVRR